jgi:hypothetical protein
MGRLLLQYMMNSLCGMKFYSYNKTFLTEAEKQKIRKELESKWDYHESDLLEVFEDKIKVRF